MGGYESDPYYVEPTWTLDFNDVDGLSPQYTNTETIEGDIALYLDVNATSGSAANVKYIKNSGSAVGWTNNTTINLLENDTLSLKVWGSSEHEGEITLTKDSSSGREIGSFLYTITNVL